MWLRRRGLPVGAFRPSTPVSSGGIVATAPRISTAYPSRCLAGSGGCRRKSTAARMPGLGASAGWVLTHWCNSAAVCGSGAAPSMAPTWDCSTTNRSASASVSPRPNSRYDTRNDSVRVLCTQAASSGIAVS